MHKAAVIVLLAASAVAMVHAGVPTPAPRYTIDLDADPKTRWTSIVAPLAAAGAYEPIMAYLDQYYWPIIQPFFDPLLGDLDAYIPAPFADEIRSCAQGINGANGLDLGKIVLLNLMYDLSAFCTSIVAQAADGSIIHGRNLDYPFPGLQNITVTVDYQRNGVTVYSGTTFAGYVGILSGVRAGGWSVTVNQRAVDGDHPIKEFMQNILEGVEGAYPIGMRLRQTLEQNATYADAVETLQHVPLWGPVYLTTAGTQPGEGAIITRDRTDPADVWWIASPQSWYRGQTNDDHWLQPKDDRRAAMNAMMTRLNASSINAATLYDVLSTAPVFNSATRYTSIIKPLTGELDTTVRFDAPSAADMEAEGWNLQESCIALDDA